MEPLKEMFNKSFYRNFADKFHTCYPSFEADNFFKEVTEGLSSFELNQRLRNTTVCLHKFLPKDFKKAISILRETAPSLKTGYTALVLPDFVSMYGKEHFNLSMDALKYFTRFGSSEFAIRVFLQHDLQRTLKVMYAWAEDENHHVRRLASEGSRPRLPWSFKLPDVMNNPSLTKPIVEKLKADGHPYVKKSVANHLNDFSKEQPEYLLQLVSGWDTSNANTKWIIKHACRTLIKNGHPGTLKLFSFSQNVKLRVSKLKLSAKKLALGEALVFNFDLSSESSSEQKLVIDYAITYARPGAKPSRKIFKLKELTLGPHETVTITKRQLFQQFTTRTHYKGKHAIEILVNGNSLSKAEFHLIIPANIEE